MSFKKIIHEQFQKICFTPTYEGEYRINLEWNNYATSVGTILVHTQGYAFSNKVKISGKGLNRANINLKASFQIDCSKIQSIQPRVYITNIFNDHEDIAVDISEVTKNIYECSYVTENSGNGQLFIVNVLKFKHFFKIFLKLIFSINLLQ